MLLDLKKINEFLLKQSGSTYEIFFNVTQGTKERIKPLFFQKYQSIPNALNRTGHVFTAPVFLAVIALELAVNVFVESVTALTQLAKGESYAKAHGGTALLSAILALIALVGACLSPFVNMATLLGGAAATVLAKPEPTMSEQPIMQTM
jgi:predicted benzoate:H+ symporter BenE